MDIVAIKRNGTHRAAASGAGSVSVSGSDAAAASGSDAVSVSDFDVSGFYGPCYT